METAETEQPKIHPKFGVRVPYETQKKARVMKAHKEFKSLGEYVTSLINKDYEQFEQTLTEDKGLN